MNCGKPDPSTRARNSADFRATECFWTSRSRLVANSFSFILVSASREKSNRSIPKRDRLLTSRFLAGSQQNTLHLRHCRSVIQFMGYAQAVCERFGFKSAAEVSRPSWRMGCKPQLEPPILVIEAILWAPCNYLSKQSSRRFFTFSKSNKICFSKLSPKMLFCPAQKKCHRAENKHFLKWFSWLNLSIFH